MNNQYNLAERLKFLMKLRAFTISELAADANISEDTIKAIRSGRTLNPGINILVSIADVLECTIDNLIDRTHSDDSETELLRKWRSLDSHGRNLAMLLIDNELSKQPAFTNSTRVIRCIVPSAYIGNGALYDSKRDEYISIPANYMKNASLAVKILGDSLIPSYFQDDILAIEERSPRPEETALYLKDNITYIRKYMVMNGRPRLIPPFAANNEVELKNISEYSCLGTIIGVIRHSV